MSGTIPITFAGADVTVWVDPGTTVLEAARRAGIVIPAPCGGAGRCGKCAIRILEGDPAPPAELESHGLALAPKGMRLACLLTVDSPITVKPVVTQSVRSVASTGEDDSHRRLLAAIDLGTTTVHAVVIDEGSGMELGRGVAPNTQQSWGADVASRIAAAGQGADADLKRAAERSIISALEVACGSAGGCLRHVSRVVIAANTAMSALLLGDDVSALGEAPYRSPRVGSADLEGMDFMRLFADGAMGLVMPAIASFVGGDVAAGIAVAGIGDVEGSAFLLDLGTNAEIVCASNSRLWVASASAGPAFEAVGIASGGPATDGAISRVEYANGSLELHVIGDKDPLWLCGTGLLSLVRVLLETGHVAADGRLCSSGPLEERFHLRDDVLALEVTPGGSVVLTQKDIRALQLAKGAVAAGIVMVARAADIKPKDLSEIVVAGAFGSAIDPEDLVRLGILPSESRGKIRVSGNTSLLGAAMVAVRPDTVERIEEVTRGVTHVELASNPEFTNVFMTAMSLEPFFLKRAMRR